MEKHGFEEQTRVKPKKTVSRLNKYFFACSRVRLPVNYVDLRLLDVVYFDQLMGAPHALHWLKSFVFALKQVFSYFSVPNGKKERAAVQKHAIN